LLALGAEPAKRAPLELKREVVSMGSVGGKTTLQIYWQALVQLQLELVDGRGTRAGAVGEARSARQPELDRDVGETGRQELHHLRPIQHELEAVTSELARPAPERGGRRGAGSNAGQERVALCQRARVLTPRIPSSRPERGDDLVEV